VAKASTSKCRICTGPARREVDAMLVMGYREKQIAGSLAHTGLTGQEIKSHKIARHVDIDRGSLIVWLIGFMHDLRKLDNQMATYVPDENVGWLTDPEESIAQGKSPEAVEMAARASTRFHETRRFGYRIKQVEARMRALEIMARIGGLSFENR
jgi:hypothetical protein